MAERILILTGQAGSDRQLIEWLKEKGYAVRTAGSKPELLAALSDSAPSLTDDETAARIEEERYHTIKQVAKSLSSFMGQIATDAQDGLRYFGEMPYFMAIHGSDGIVRTVNQTYKQYIGDQTDRPSWEIYCGERRNSKDCPVGRTINSRSILTTRAVIKYQSGVEVPVFVHTAPIFNSQGDIELVVEVFAGIKEIENMAEEARTTQHRYRKLFDAVPNYVVVLDRQLRLAVFNQRFLEDFGFKTGRRFYDIFRPVHSTSKKGPIDRTLEDGTEHQGEMVLFAPNGDQLKLMAWTSPVKSAAGKLLAVLVIFTDVTELRRLQNNLSQLGLMISTVTHSLKGSLTGLDAGLYMIDKGFYRNQPGRIEEGLDVAKLMTERIRKLVRDVLYYAKERELEVEVVDAEQLAIDVASSVRMRVLGANIEFNCDFDPDAGKIEIDQGLIQTALINLIENAVEACIEDQTDKSYVITFSLQNQDDHVIYRVSDNGVGLNQEDIKNIFQQFWSTKGKKGTGLGLFIASQVIQKHGGKITVSTDQEGKTTFAVRLPKVVRLPKQAAY